MDRHRLRGRSSVTAIMISVKKTKGRKPLHDERKPGDQNMLSEERDEKDENLVRHEMV